MLLEVLVTALLIYLQFLDRSVGLWAMSAAIVSLVGEYLLLHSIPYFSVFHSFLYLRYLQLEPPVMMQHFHTSLSNAKSTFMYV